MSKYEDFFCDVMLVEELGLMPPDPDAAPWKNGLSLSEKLSLRRCSASIRLDHVRCLCDLWRRAADCVHHR
jgi:hypothetical protein